MKGKNVMKFIEKFSGWLQNQGLDLIGVLLKALIIAVIGILIIKTVGNIINRALNKSKLEKAAHSLIKTLSKTVMYILLALIIASSIGIDVTGIVALASVLTLALSLALQDMLSNVIGGFTLIYTHPFASGDYVEIAAQSGTVKEVGIAYTKLITPDNKVISIPNKAVVAAEIVNYTVAGTRRLDITVTASYDAEPEDVIKTLLKAVEGEPIITENAPFAALTNYGESSIEYVLRVWTKNEDYWNVNFSLLSKLKPMFKEAGIEMTYPHLNVHIDK